jgi:rhomboid protease GluP
LDELATTYRQHASALAGHSLLAWRLSVQLSFAASAGHLALTERLATSPALGLSDSVRNYWLGVAALAAADEVAGRQLLGRVVTYGEPSAARLAQLRLSQPTAAVRPSAAVVQLLAEIERELGHEAVYGALQDTTVRPYATRVLLALNMLGFGVELWLGDPAQAEVLYDAGALLRIPEQPLLLHDAYRVLTSLFLHFGWLHLCMNAIGLWALGPFVERRLGALRAVLVYLVSGLTGSILTATLPRHTPVLFAGASGCIMGLVGASLAIYLDGHLRERAGSAKAGAWRVAIVLVQQLVFDLTVPGISLLAHWSGVAVGLALGYVLVRQRVRVIAT